MECFRNRLYMASSRNRNWQTGPVPIFSFARQDHLSAFPCNVSKVVVPPVACSLLSTFPSTLVVARWVTLVSEVSEVGASLMASAAFPDSSVQAGVAFNRI